VQVWSTVRYRIRIRETPSSNLITCESLRFYNIPVKQARSRRDASACSAPITNLVTPTRNVQNIYDKCADQPTKKKATPYLINAFPLWNQLETTHFQKCVHMQDVLYNVIGAIMQLMC